MEDMWASGKLPAPPSTLDFDRNHYVRETLTRVSEILDAGGIPPSPSPPPMKIIPLNDQQLSNLAAGLQLSPISPDDGIPTEEEYLKGFHDDLTQFGLDPRDILGL
ncbi:hypothetical protein TWF730_005397 [Orbilia blumenaviensis]|uniref:Uncharacterized protein n=1 Tax=Orbilia blumenaviensis TaxID=1796055 RepID=A0AAV9VIP3_9PEZI